MFIDRRVPTINVHLYLNVLITSHLSALCIYHFLYISFSFVYDQFSSNFLREALLRPTQMMVCLKFSVLSRGGMPRLLWLNSLMLNTLLRYINYLNVVTSVRIFKNLLARILVKLIVTLMFYSILSVLVGYVFPEWYWYSLPRFVLF